MNMHYAALGLEEGASEQDIKRAYFQLVRQHSPEKDPEGFRKIREAYEALRSKSDEDENAVHVSFNTVNDGFANCMWQQILEAEQTEDYEFARDMAEDAMRYFPADERFSYCASRFNRYCGNAGKAVKAAKKLVKLNPEKPAFQRELALANYDRGYYRQAKPAFERAWELGVRDMEFISSYAFNCESAGQTARGLQILLEQMHRPLSKPTEEKLSGHMNVWICLQNFAANMESDDFPYDEVYTDIRDVMEKYPRLAADHVSSLAETVYMIATTHDGGIRETESALFHQMEKLSSTDREREVIKLFTGRLLDQQDPTEDARFNEDFTDWIVLETAAGLLIDQQEMKFMRVNMFLIQLEDPTEALRQFEILEREYPSCYDKFKHLAEELRSAEDIDALRGFYLEKHDRMLKNFESSYYYEKFPQRAMERHDNARLVYSAQDNTPYVRETKKIGRNDPCPCGSGKKYKNCCLKKGA